MSYVAHCDGFNVEKGDRRINPFVERRIDNRQDWVFCAATFTKRGKIKGVTKVEEAMPNGAKTDKRPRGKFAAAASA